MKVSLKPSRNWQNQRRRTTNDQRPATNDQQPTTSGRWMHATDKKNFPEKFFPKFSFFFLVTFTLLTSSWDHVLVIGCWSFIWLLPYGRLVVGCWSLVVVFVMGFCSFVGGRCPTYSLLPQTYLLWLNMDSIIIFLNIFDISQIFCSAKDKISPTTNDQNLGMHAKNTIEFLLGDTSIIFPRIGQKGVSGLN